MRLLHTTRLEFRQFFDAATPEYAILSHTWGDDEMTFQDFGHKRKSGAASFQKIADCCKLARRRGLEWVWIDTCCIDKTSSAELSEAINSMFQWYQRSKVCYVFLSDLVVQKPLHQGFVLLVQLQNCRWFTRGWTLQELLAPSDLEFYDSRLSAIGTANSLAHNLSIITGIGTEYLLHQVSFHQASIAQRMSWASQRETSRVEDMAYCLLGIFNVNMPLLHGEGEKAFLRLQQQIVGQSSDESIFAWVSEDPPCGHGVTRGLFADGPRYFRYSGGIYHSESLSHRPPYTLTNRGLKIDVPKPPLTLGMDLWLNCVHQAPGLDLNIVGIRVRAFGSSINEDAEWYRESSNSLLLRKKRRVNIAQNFFFRGWRTIYAAQSALEFRQCAPKACCGATRGPASKPSHFTSLSVLFLIVIECLCVFWILPFLLRYYSTWSNSKHLHESSWASWATYAYALSAIFLYNAQVQYAALCCFVLYLGVGVDAHLVRGFVTLIYVLLAAEIFEVVVSTLLSVLGRNLVPLKALGS